MEVKKRIFYRWTRALMSGKSCKSFYVREMIRSYWFMLCRPAPLLAGKHGKNKPH